MDDAKLDELASAASSIRKHVNTHDLKHLKLHQRQSICLLSNHAKELIEMARTGLETREPPLTSIRLDRMFLSLVMTITQMPKERQEGFKDLLDLVEWARSHHPDGKTDDTETD